MALLACLDVAVILVVLPMVSRWAGLICCICAWAAWFGFHAPYRGALSTLGRSDRRCVQRRMGTALGLLGVSSIMVIFAWR